MDCSFLSAEVYYPLSVDGQLTGRIGDYWWENGQVKYKKAELQDCAPPESLYTNYERVVTVNVLADPSEPLVRRLLAKK